MTKKITEETVFNASVTKTDGSENKTASITTNNFEELERFLHLAGVKSDTMATSVPSCGEGWADESPVDMDAAGFVTGGEPIEANMEVSCEDVDTTQAEYDYGHRGEQPKPYDIDAYDYKGRPESDTDERNFRRVNHYGDNAMPKTEGIERLRHLAGIKGVEENLSPISGHEDDSKADEIDTLSSRNTWDDCEDVEMDEARARRPNSREDTMMHRIDREKERGDFHKFKPRGDAAPDDKYAAMAARRGIDSKMDRPTHDRVRGMSKESANLEKSMFEEFKKFVNEYNEKTGFGKRKPTHNVVNHPLYQDMIADAEEMIRWTGNVEDAAAQIAKEYAPKMKVAKDLIYFVLTSEYGKMDKTDIRRSQQGRD